MWNRLFACAGLVALVACGSTDGNEATAASTAAGAGTPRKSESVEPTAIFPYVNVKTWTGTVTAEASGSSKAASGDITSVMTYNATGPITITDNQMPEGSHGVWPLPSAEEQADPTRAADAFKKWPAHVVFKTHSTGIDELGQKVDVTCVADVEQQALVQVMMVPTGSMFWLNVEPPSGQAQCSGTSQIPAGFAFPQTRLKIEGKVAGPADPISGTQQLLFGDVKAKITYHLTPR